MRQGDRVALVLPASVGFAEHFWAIQLLGAAPCAFSRTTPPRLLSTRVKGIRPRLVVSEELDHGSAPVALPDTVIETDRVAVLQSTSGTSGAPRAAALTHRNLLTHLRATRELRHIGQDDVLVSWVPPWHDLGLVRFIVAPVYFGTPCHIVEPAIRTIREWLATVERVGGTVTGAPDFAYRTACRLVAAGSVDLSSLRYATNGGEPVRRSTVEAFEARFAARGAVIPGYGLAEATLGVASHSIGADLAVDARGNVSCGLPFPGLEVLAGESAEAPEEILIAGDAVFAGYLDAPEETAVTLCDGWLHTGDDGYVDDAGRLFVLGRRRAMIKRGGAVVAPRELEEAAHEVAGVRLAAALSTPPSGSALTESVIVVVEAAAEGAHALRLQADVSAAIRNRVGFSAQRVHVVAPRTIPRTENGKIRHAALASRLNELPRALDPE